MLATTRPTSPTDASPSTVQQWVAAFVLMSPNSKSEAMKALDAIKPLEPARSSKILFTVEKEISIPLGSIYALGVHQTVVDLACAGQYLPLTLFTNEATQRLHREGHTIKKIECSVKGVTQYLLDVSLFQDEKTLDALTWHEAWNRYLGWLEDVAASAVYERWLWHFTTLSKDQDVRRNFRAILLFDMELRMQYAARPFVHNILEWQIHLQSTKQTVIDRLLHDVRIPSSRRYEPYDTSRRSAKRSSDTKFVRKEPDSRVKSKLPTCIICQRSHHYHDCKEETTTRGQPTFAKCLNGQLVRRSNDILLCVSFNLSNVRFPCENTHAPTHHACSFCGDSTHGALSRLCL